MSIPYHRPISSQFTRDEDYFLKGMPESVLPSPSPKQEQKRPKDGGVIPEVREESDLSDQQLSELRRYRDVIKTMGRELSNLQTTISKLQTENQSLRKSSATNERMMSVILTDPNAEVLDSTEDFVERYVALQAKLEEDLAEFKKYKDKVQRLQNQLIKANDREKNYLNFEVNQTNEEENVKPVNLEQQKIRKLENTVTQQENTIRDLERALRDYLDRKEQRRKSAKSSISSASSSRSGLTVTIREPHENEIVKLMEENARLREEMCDLRISMQQDDLKNLQLNEDLAFSEQRIESLEAQNNQNAQNWAREKRELAVRLHEQKSNIAHHGGLDVSARHSF